MKVSAISNTNFSGKFKKTPALDKLMAYSDKYTLERFNDIIDRAAKVNDNIVYNIDEKSFAKRVWLSVETHSIYNLIEKNANSNYSYPIASAEANTVRYDYPNVYKCNELKSVLSKLLPALEKKYPKEPEFNKEIIEKIDEKLIKE